MRKKYRVEIFIDNGWIVSSRHGDEDIAIINADVISKSRQCQARVIFNGDIVYQID